MVLITNNPPYLSDPWSFVRALQVATSSIFSWTAEHNDGDSWDFGDDILV